MGRRPGLVPLPKQCCQETKTGQGVLTTPHLGQAAGCRGPPAHALQPDPRERREAGAVEQQGSVQCHGTAAEPIRSCRRTPSAVPGPRRSCQALQTSSSRLGRAPGILMRLCPNRERPGAQPLLPGRGVHSAAAPAAPRHSPCCRTQRPARLPARQQQAACRSRRSVRRWWGQGPACWPHRAGTEPSSARTGGGRRRRRHFPGP